MAHRGTPGHRLPGNTLAGILRDLDRRSRATIRRTGRPAASKESEESTPATPPPSALTRSARPTAAVITTDEHGRARWEFPCLFAAPPVLTALPAGTGVLTAVLEELNEAGATVRVWRPAVDGRSPTPAVDVHVHCTATAVSA
ncbi:hypothetical protein E1265_12825 [Streptomyces sp. 8K308]|uniref:hypothetical protein n=1 Tax=Streptomyces sp. 8K308 TaxID=2530388 RepID=UPI001049A162|nr:hypothetical protein [Streptomyces sp. 8K308]TDC23415.1 hypothetical protein E1265_12825 [Streptomyces sp. 8K308]